MKRGKPTHSLKVAPTAWAALAGVDSQKCWAIQGHGVTCHTIFAFLVHKAFLGRSRKVRVSDGQVARFTGISTRTIIRCRPLLRDAGLIAYRERTEEEIRRNQPFLYTVRCAVFFEHPAGGSDIMSGGRDMTSSHNPPDIDHASMSHVIRTSTIVDDVLIKEEAGPSAGAAPAGAGGPARPAVDAMTDEQLDEYIKREVGRIVT